MSTANMNTTARKAAAALLASCARVLKMAAFCMAVAAVPVACTALTGFAPIDCEVAFCD